MKQVSPQALDVIYNARQTGSRHRAAMFKIELEGIEKLNTYVKNPENRFEIAYDRTKVTMPIRARLYDKEYLEALDSKGHPDLAQCLNWLRTMKMPQAEWSGDHAGEPLEAVGEAIKKPAGIIKKVADTLIGSNETWFVKLEQKYLQAHPAGQIVDAASWQRFLDAQSEQDRTIIGELAGQIKKALQKINVLKGDDDLIKFDTKDHPLFFYQEGTDIIPAEDWLKACIENSARRADYARAFCGDTPDMQQKAGWHPLFPPQSA